MAKTIDNLGPDASTRYAEDKKLYDEKLVKDARLIPKQTEIDVTLPAFPSEVDELFEKAKRNATWANFLPPPKFNEQKKRLYTQQIIPSLGSSDKKEAWMRRINETVAQTKTRIEEKKASTSMTWEEERELQDEEKEKTQILSLLKRVEFFERAFIDINSRRQQYHKG